MDPNPIWQYIEYALDVAIYHHSKQPPKSIGSKRVSVPNIPLLFIYKVRKGLDSPYIPNTARQKHG